MKLIRRRTAARFSRRPVERSSSTTTSCPAPTRCSTRCDPMNPAPPVMRHLIADQPCTSHARRVRRILPTASVPHVSHTCFRGARGDAAAHHWLPTSAAVRYGYVKDRGRIIGRWRGRALPPTAPQQHHRHGAEHDLRVLERRLPPDVLEVVAHFAAHVIYGRVVSLVDLRQAGDARPNALTPLVALDLLAQVHEDRGLLRPRADHVHVAHEDVEQLGQLVEPELPQHPAERRHPRIIRQGPRLLVFGSGRTHRPELVHRERLTALIDVAACVATRVRQRATVEPHARLSEEHRPARRELDQRRDHEHDGRSQDEPHGGYGDVEHATGPALPVAGAVRRDAHQRDRGSGPLGFDESRYRLCHGPDAWQGLCAGAMEYRRCILRRLGGRGGVRVGLLNPRDIAIQHRLLSHRDAAGQGDPWAHRPMLSAGHSISKKNRLPQLGRLSTRSSEPIARTSLAQMASPSPEPEKWWRPFRPLPSPDTGRTGWLSAA